MRHFDLPSIQDITPDNCIDYVILHGLDDVLAYLKKEDTRLRGSLLEEEVTKERLEVVVKGLYKLEFMGWLISKWMQEKQPHWCKAPAAKALAEKCKMLEGVMRRATRP